MLGRERLVVPERLGFRHEDLDPRLNEVASVVVDAVGEVRRELGVGLLESVYRDCLVEELRLRGVEAHPEVRVPIVYKGIPLHRTLRIDVLVEGKLVVETKAADALHPIDFAQTLSYLRLSKRPLALLVNFNALPLRNGIRRLVNSRAPA